MKAILKILLILSRKCPVVCPITMIGLLGAACRAIGDEQFAVALPTGVKAVWDLGKAERESTATRERICLNGLWRWQPADADANRPPAGNWGYFKVPGCWPGITDYKQKDCQTLFAHPSLEGPSARPHHDGLVPARDHDSQGLDRPPHRTLAGVPELLRGGLCGWQASRRGALSGGRGGSHLGLPAGREAPAQLARRRDAAQGRAAFVSRHELRPAGARHCEPARPLRRCLPRQHAGWRPDHRYERRDLGAPIGDHVRRCGFGPDRGCDAIRLRARITKDGQTVREFTSPAFKGSDLKDGRFTFSKTWKPDKLWDIDTPQNML